MQTHLLASAVAAAALALAASCDGELNRVDAVRRIINESSAEVQVTVFDAIDTVRFTLTTQDTFEMEGTCIYDEIRECELGWVGNARSEVMFVKSSGDTSLWSTEFDLERDIGADPQFEQAGYTAETINGLIIYTFRILESDIPR